MVEARWNGTLVARSNDTVVVEGNHYFPMDTVDVSRLRQSMTTTICPWKGEAHYYDIRIDGAENSDAAWYYPDPKSAAEDIRGRVAFWKGVEVG